MLDNPMQMHHCSVGPALTVQIYVHENQVTETVIYPHSETGFSWQIVSDHPYPMLEVELEGCFKDYGEGHDLKNSLLLNWKGVTPFTIKVLNEIQQIPFGQVKTYHELAQAIGEPNAARAVGGACGRNPFPWIIPCHRVVAAGRKIGDYSLDILIKKRLLEFEGVHLTL